MNPKQIVPPGNDSSDSDIDYQFEFDECVAANVPDDSYLPFQEDDLSENNCPVEEDDIKFSDLPTNSDINFLNEDEQEAINSCTDSELSELMVLNRTKNIHLLKLFHKISILLEFTRRQLTTETAKCSSTLPTAPVLKSNVWKLGSPYFKDRDCYGCRWNSDVKRKLENDELLQVPQPVKWYVEDEVALRSAITLNYQERLLKSGGVSKCDSKTFQVPDLGQEDLIDWKQVSSYLKEKQSPSVCRKFWTLHLHPSINKTKWTPNENKRLKQLVAKHKHQNWDAIASELDTRRTCYALCVHYFSKLNERFRKERFLKEEDDFLMEVIANCRIGSFIPWSKVAYYVKFRSKHQLYHRYTYYLSVEKDACKHQFTVEEDAMIVHLVKRFGRRYQQIAPYMPGRTSMQIKNRYIGYLHNLNFEVGAWTLEEDKLILEHVEKHGCQQWSLLGRVLNRPRANTRHRYDVIKKYLETKQMDITKVPRRACPKISTQSNSHMERVKQLIAEYESCESIPTPPVKPTVPCGAKRRVLPQGAHAGLISFFKSSCKMANPVLITDGGVKQSAEIICNVLRLLNAKLEIDDGVVCRSRCLDAYDTSLLHHVRRNLQAKPHLQASPSEDGTRWSLPPNLNTVVGLRNMILKHSARKQKPILRAAERLNLNGGTCTADEKSLFRQRLCCLFEWPSILSLFEPNRYFTNAYLEGHQKERAAVVKKRGRPTKYACKRLANVQKMLQTKCELHRARDEAASKARPTRSCKRKMSVVGEGDGAKKRCAGIEVVKLNESVEAHEADDDLRDIGLLKEVINAERK